MRTGAAELRLMVNLGHGAWYRTRDGSGKTPALGNWGWRKINLIISSVLKVIMRFFAIDDGLW